MSSFTLQQKIDIVEHILALLLMFPSIFSLQMIQDSPYGLSWLSEALWDDQAWFLCVLVHLNLKVDGKLIDKLNSDSTQLNNVYFLLYKISYSYDVWSDQYIHV